MKKFIIPIVLFAAVACSTEVLEGPEILSERHITISASISDPETRTERASYGTVLWCPGDEISLFYGSGADGGSRFTSQNTEKAKVADFSGTINVITGGNGISEDDTYFWAVYPYDSTASCDGESITTNLPSKQVAVAGTFANGLFPTLGRSKGVSMPFYNICGGLKFSVTEEGIKSVTLKGNNNEIIAGRITVGFDDGGVPVVRNIREGSETIAVAAPEGEYLEVGKAYYIVMVPTEFERGFTLTFEKDSSKAIKTRQEKTTIRRSVFGVIANVDNNLEWGEAISVEIPDENFRAYMLQSFDINGDGILDSREAESVTRIEVNTDDITSLEGVEYCINLTVLHCSGSETWNESKDEYISNGRLTSLGVSQNTALTNLRCSCNQLTSLDVSKNTALTYLNCRSNQLTSLDVSQNTALTYLSCGSNQLTSLDVSHNTSLTTGLECYNNLLTSLDVSKNTALTYLRCRSNQLTSLDVSQNTALTSLYCYNNQLTSLDVSQNIALTRLDCYNNLLTSLDVSKNTALTVLYCYNNLLTSLDVSQNTALTSLYCYNSQLTSLDVSRNPALQYLRCYNNLLTSLDVSQNTALSSLYCSPMSDSLGNNLLGYLFIYQGQPVPYVTEGRSTDYIPAGTVIMVAPETGGNEEIEAVDLGLSVKWATMNVGANKPEGYGYYFAWGETAPISDHRWQTYKFTASGDKYDNVKFFKYCTQSSYWDSSALMDNKTVLDPEDDAAHVYLGGSWRIPTDAEWTELRENCTWNWTGNYNGTGVAGIIVSSNKAGYTDRSIFLPAAGYRQGTQSQVTGSSYYWSSSLNIDIPRCAWDVYFNPGNVARSYRSRVYGHSIRPVTE